MIARLLIANRGEIAVRIARTAREMGIAALGIYSDADTNAYHRTAMDESLRIGPAPAAESYLDIDTILAAARTMRADAVHPGYGFLSERAGFARAVTDAGMRYVGPSADAIAAMGSKIESKRLVRERGVPTIPGYDGDDMSVERLRAEAERIGTPVLIKASAGGGGRGMRVVDDLTTFEEALESARREALASFGDDRVLLERYLRRPRHIEIQIVADSHGAIVHLGERECSIQRRHQKVVEEAPSVAVDAELRARMGAAAILTAQAVGYESAGTVEFMLDSDGAFYFLEMNTRIQVEHPVTEEVYGIDLVRLQIDIANGAHMQLEGSALVPRGHAIEARLYAEDPATGFLPSSGSLERFAMPTGPGVRVDAGVAEGSDVSVYYDPMLAKIIVWAGDRPAAIARLQRALEATTVLGVRTNLPLLHFIARDEAFAGGETTTRYLEERVPADAFATPKIDTPTLALAVGAMLRAQVSWRLGGVGIPLALSIEAALHTVVATRVDDLGTWLLRGDLAGDIVVEPYGGITFAGDRIDGSSSFDGANGHVARAMRTTIFTLAPPPRAGAHAHTVGGSSGTVVAPMPGRIANIAVAIGDVVDERALLVVLEAMKMEHRIVAPLAGTVRDVRIAVGDLVAAGATLVTIA